jgi:hypothetical protein
MKKILMLLVLMIFAECSYAGFTSGNDLAKWMVEYEKSDNDNTISMYAAGQYDGYLMGIADITNRISWCNPGNVTHGQMFKIVSKYLHNNPEKLHFDAYSLVTQALKEAFPCKK